MEAARRDNTLSGRVLEGRYRIVDELGEGGMGTVYRAEHLKLGRKVALKVLLAEYGDNTTLRARFEREAKALAALSHPNVVTVTDYGLADELPYIVMELLEGRTLKDRLADGPLDPDEAFRITREMLRGLAYAHGQGLAHRDLKPGNVFLQALPDGLEHVKVLDFGLAKFVAADEQAAGAALTRLGSVLGTPAYMAPEQASGDTSDMRSDVYAVGILLVEMLSGKRPFDGEPGDVLRQQLLSPLPSISSLAPDREASPALESFLARATAKERSARFQNASEMLTALDALPQPAMRRVSGVHPQRAELPTRVGGKAARDVAALGTAATMPGSLPAAQARASVAKSRPGNAIAAALGAGAFLVVALGAIVIAIVIFISQSDDDTEPSQAETSHAAERPPPSEPSPRPVTRPEPAQPMLPAEPAVEEEPEPPEPVVAEPAQGASALPPDPWSTPVPRILADTKRAVDRGWRVSGGLEGRIRTHARDHRDDPRPHILLGRIYLARGWRPDAMERFEAAFSASPSAAGDPKALEALIELAGHARTSSRAAALLRQHYGVHAIGAIDEALSGGRLERSDAERLLRVRQSLR